MKPNRTTGLLLLAGVWGILLPYTTLTLTFSYPDILRESPGAIMTAFQQGGLTLLLTWLAFALGGSPLLGAYTRLQAMLPERYALYTQLGLVGLLVQQIGLLRWVLVVPSLARAWQAESDPARQAAWEAAFQVQHYGGGVLLGEFVGQSLTILWTLTIFQGLYKAGFASRLLRNFAWVAGVLYALGLNELMQQAWPDWWFWEPAAFIGSTAWLLVLAALGIRLYRQS